MEGDGETPEEVMERTRETVRDTLLLVESLGLDLLSVVTGLGEGGSGEIEGVEDDGWCRAGLGDRGR